MTSASSLDTSSRIRLSLSSERCWPGIKAITSGLRDLSRVRPLGGRLSTSKALDLLQNVHSGFSELERGVPYHGQNHEDNKRRPEPPFERCARLDSHDGRERGIKCIQNRCDTEGDEDLPCCEDVAPSNLDLRSSKCLWEVNGT